jgi:hypothetical protein
MSIKVKDLVEVVASAGAAPVSDASANARVAPFHLSYEIGDLLDRIVERVARRGDGPRNVLVVGGPGCGKSRVLDVVGEIFETAPERIGHQRLAALQASTSETRVLVVRVPSGGLDLRLSTAVERATLERLTEAGFSAPIESEGSGSRLDVVSRVAASLPDGLRLLFLVDDLDRWLDAATRYALENAHTLIRLGELARKFEVAVCAAAGEYVISHDSSSSEQGWIAAMLGTYRIEYVSARALRSAIAAHVLVKNARQRREIAKVLDQLRSRLPHFDTTDEEFIELYPLAISTWSVGAHLHRHVPGFSLPEFVRLATASVMRRPAASLFALNDLFALYEPQLRRVDLLAASFEAYDRLVADALPRLGQSQRLWGRLGLQSIFMHTVAGIAADVPTIVNSVLLYDLHGGESSHEMMSAVLKQLETLDSGQLVASGEGANRRYSFVIDEREALVALVDDMADEIDPDEATAALLKAGGSVFADWPLAAGAGEMGRLDLWEIQQGDGWISLEAKSSDESQAERPRLTIFSPGRPWHEANEHAKRRPATACWIAAMPSPFERDVLRRWVAATRLARSERGSRFADLGHLLAELDDRAASFFRRAYVEAGTRVTAEHSDAVADLVGDARGEKLVVRLLPLAHDATATVDPSLDALWISALLGDEGSGSEDRPRRLEGWYRARVARDDAGLVRTLGERAAESPEIAAALEVRRRFDAVLVHVRRALAASRVEGLGIALSSIFESPEELRAARARLAWLDAMTDWLVKLERMRCYLASAETTDDEELEELRRELQSRAGRVEELVVERRRTELDTDFDDYRDVYARIYRKRHDAAVGRGTIDRMGDKLVTSDEWRGLEALSALSIGTQTYLVDAINLISELRGAQCLGVSSLDEHPFCTCGFRFADRERIAELAASAEEFLAAGIEHHRLLLQARRAELRDALIAHKSEFSMETMRAIADLAKDGPVPATVAPETVAALNTLLAAEHEWVGEVDDERPPSLPKSV